MRPAPWRILGDLFLALNPKDLTKNQRFALACILLAIVLFVLSLVAGLPTWVNSVMALSILVFIFWTFQTNRKS